MKRFLALFAACALTLSLAGCDPAATKPPVSPPPESSPPVGAYDVAMQIAGIPADTVLLTVDGEPVTAEIYLYWLLYTASSYDSYMQYYYGQSLNWEEEIEGQTLAGFLKDDSREAAKFFAVMATRANQYGCGLTAEQLQSMDDDRQAMIDELGSEEEYAFNLKYAGISDTTLYALNTTSFLYQNLTDYFFGGENAPTASALTEYIEANELLWAKHILILTQDASGAALPEEGLADAKTRAEELLSALLAAGDNQAALFDDLMNQYSEDTGLADYPDGYMFGPGDMVPEFENATRALAFGQMTDALVQTDYGYHIILRLEPRLAGELTDQYTEEKFDALTTQWLEETTVVEAPEYAALDAKAVYDAMQAFRAELEAEHAAAESPAPSESPKG